MVRKTFILFSAIFCMACAMPSAAAPSASPIGAMASDASDTPSFDDLDKNHDGKLTRSEIPKDVESLKQLRAHFREADRDGNGSLSQEEYQEYVAANTASGL